MNEFEKFKYFSLKCGPSGDIEFQDNMIESSRTWTLEYQRASHSSARNTATEMRGGDRLSHGDS